MENSTVINLRKDQKVTLKKESGEYLETIHTGLRWAKIPITTEKISKGKTERVYTGNWIQRLLKIGKYEDKVVASMPITTVKEFKDVDLDSSILVYDDEKQLYDVIYYGNKDSRNPGAIHHHGDDLVGGLKESDNETIDINFKKLNKKVKYLIVILNSFTHEKFDELPFAQMKIYDNKKLFAEFTVSKEPKFVGKEALILGVFTRMGGDYWDFKAIGEATGERSIGAISKGSVSEILKNL